MTRPEVRLRRAALAIFEASIGSPAKRMRAQPGGQTNLVFMLESDQGSFVLRMDQQVDKLYQYRKERWAIDHARRMHIPVPKVIEVGSTPNGVSFMLSRREPGRLATSLPDTGGVLRQLGQYARKLHEGPLAMYGGHQDDVTAPWKTWPEFLEHEFKLDQRLKQLQALDLIDEATAAQMADVVLQLGTSREPRLNHGDLRLKNVLVDGAGRINAIIDWENAVAAPAPEWELALALHDLSIDEKDAFLDGYGLEAADLMATRAALAALNMLHYAPFAERGAQAGNDQRMRHYRRRFARVYDFYSP
jgi:aminoglycoside phosphotransferase (APT) family kinase protein